MTDLNPNGSSLPERSDAQGASGAQPPPVPGTQPSPASGTQPSPASGAEPPAYQGQPGGAAAWPTPAPWQPAAAPPDGAWPGVTPPAAPRRRDPLVVGAVVASAIAVVLLFVLAGVAAWALLTPRDGAGRAAGNEDPTSSAVVKDYRDREDLLSPDHATGEIDYEINPPVGGRHNDIWQNCQGDIYDKPIADEHAVHSLEHGAVWITYRPGLKPSEIDKLAQRVRDRDFMMMSPHKALDRSISLQAWGLQLKTDRADDPAIDQFIEEHRMTAALEPGAPCSGGTTKTGDRPEDGD